MDGYDLIVVGASFAGLVAARQAALRGLSVLVLERKAEPGAHVHTTGILVREAAEELQGQMPVPDALVRAVPGVRLYAPNLTHTDLTSRGYAFYTTDTAGLLRHLAAEAEAAGATIRYGVPFEGAARGPDTIEIPGAGARGRYLLGADGAKSRVAEAFGLGVNRRFLVGLEVEYAGLEAVDPRFLHTFLDSRIAPGYIGWVAPGVGVTQVGLAAKRADRPNLARFQERIRDLFDFTGAEIVERRSGVIPCGGTLGRVALPASDGAGVLLVGDAAGMVSPATAGGIFTAFHWGRRAADAIADWMAGAAPDPALMLPRAYPRFRVKGLLRRALDIGPPNWLLNLATGTPPMRAVARLVYFHTKGIGTKDAWRDMVRPEKADGGRPS
jgi:flavin-dependent dehydrogenase